jgi:pimeloyl-ACP methyl ester carboxylesterase
MERVAGVALERVGTGEPLLLIHGTGGSRAHWAPVLGRLAEAREVIVVDLPAHGESDPPGPEVVSPHAPIGYAQVLAGMMGELGLEAVEVAGNSVGGWSALELAKRGRARSVVAIAPAGLWKRHDPWKCVMQLSSQHRMGKAFASLTPRLMRSGAGRTMLLRGTMAKPRNMGPGEATELAQTFAHTPFFKEHLSETRRARFRGGEKIDVPVTVAWGDKERLVPKRARRTDELPAQTRFVTLPGCGHTPMWDDPELVAETILAGP